VCIVVDTNITNLLFYYCSWCKISKEVLMLMIKCFAEISAVSSSVLMLAYFLLLVRANFAITFYFSITNLNDRLIFRSGITLF